MQGPHAVNLSVNMRVLVTRPREDTDRTAAMLAARGHQAILSPLFEVRRLAADLPPVADAVLAASANGIRMADANALARFADVPFLAVGGRTADVARAAGFRHVSAGEGDAVALAALVRARCPQEARLLHLAGRPRRDDAVQALSRDYRLTVAETYETVAVAEFPASTVTALREGTIDAVLHLSPRAAQVFADLAAKSGLLAEAQHALHVFISPAAADLRLSRRRIAARPDLETVISAL